MVKDEDGKYHYIPPDSFEIVTTLIRKYKDENGMGWTQYTVKIKSKKRGCLPKGPPLTVFHARNI